MKEKIIALINGCNNERILKLIYQFVLGVVAAADNNIN